MAASKPPPRLPGRRRRTPSADLVWLYGRHAVLAAAANPVRRLRRLIATTGQAEALATAAARASAPRPSVETMEIKALAHLLPAEALHQGLAALAEPLPETTLDELLAAAGTSGHARVVVLDQVTDPRNVGAVMRSAAAFGAAAVIVQNRHAPDATPALAKAASGALETVPLVAVVNITRCLRALQDAGFLTLGLDAEAAITLADALKPTHLALVLGAEGEGLRRLVRETCDQLVRIPITASMASLNVSVAAAIALYEVRQPGT